jgi:hypothetical protein
MASLPFIQGWYARLFSNTYGENVISIWHSRSLPSVISTSLQHKCQDDGIQLLALLLPFCFGVHYHLPPQFIVLTPEVTTWHAWYQVPWLRPVIHLH